MTQFWGWMKNVFVPAIFTADSYKDQEETASEYIGNNRSILVGMPRLRQLRVMKSKVIACKKQTRPQGFLFSKWRANTLNPLAMGDT